MAKYKLKNQVRVRILKDSKVKTIHFPNEKVGTVYLRMLGFVFYQKLMGHLCAPFFRVNPNSIVLSFEGPGLSNAIMEIRKTPVKIKARDIDLL